MEPINVTYLYYGKPVHFNWTESDPDAITMTTETKTTRIPCRHKNDMAIQINKKSLSATGGGLGVINFIRNAVADDICTSFINIIVERF